MCVRLPVTSRADIDEGQIVLGFCLATGPFCLRLVYFGISIFDKHHLSEHAWGPVSGSNAAFVCMALLPDFTIFGTYAWIGVTMPRKRIALEEGECASRG